MCTTSLLVTGVHHVRPFHSTTAGKLTGLDKELSKSIDINLQNGTSEAELSSSPVGPLGQASRCAHLATAPRDRLAQYVAADTNAVHQLLK